MITFVEDKSSNYKNRTIINAAADATIAMAIDFSSAGEICTKTAVQKHKKVYIPLDLNNTSLDNERLSKIVRYLNSPYLPKFKGQMNFEYNGLQRSDIHSKTTLQAILNNERTATTRYSYNDSINYWKQCNIGDIILWSNFDGEKALVRVTNPLRKLSDDEPAEDWSSKEGWSTDYYKNNVLSKIEYAWQIEYEHIKYTINLAGNGIYSLKGKYDQEFCNNFVTELLQNIIKHPDLNIQISHIRSGGQTGFDEAGIIAAERLKIPSTVLAPKGWKFRDIEGDDIINEQLFKQRFYEKI